MQEKNYHTTLIVDRSPQQVFENINAVAKWWNEGVEGNSQKTNDEFSVRFGNMHMSKHKLVEVINDKKVVWNVTDSQLNFIKEKDEWTDTNIVFEIAEKDGKTQIDFTHVGLVPDIECYNSCTKGWDYYIKGSLFKLLTEGKGTPEPLPKN